MILEAKNILYSYKSKRDKIVLKNVSATFEEATFYAIVGSSGSGKTTFLSLLAGLDNPVSGNVLYGGEDIRKKGLNYHRRHNVSLVFQNYNLIDYLTTEENVKLGGRKNAEELLREVSIPREDWKRNVLQLSGGQQQRVALARAFVIEPGVLLMDEPLSNLDAKLRVQMRTAIKKLQRRLGITTIYVTHDQEEALAISDRIAVMKEGNIMQVGTPEAIYKKPENTFVAGFIGVSNFVDCEVKGDNPEAAVLDIKGECKITCQLKKPFSGKGIISARPEQLFFDEKEGLPGKIIMSTFLGDFIEYEIELDNGQTLQLNEYTKDVQIVRPDGQNVKVNFDIHAAGVYDAATQEVISW